MLRPILVSLILTFAPSILGAEGRTIQFYGSLSGLGLSGEAEVSLNFVFGIGLPPPTDTQNSPISRTVAVPGKNKDGTISIGRTQVRGEFSAEYSDVLVFGEFRNKDGSIDRYLPLYRIEFSGNLIEFNIVSETQVRSFFSKSFPISGFRQANSPSQNMAVFRALDILIDLMANSGGLTSCQLADIYAIVRDKVDFFAEGDPLVVYYILERMRELNRDNRLAVTESACAERSVYPYAQFYAEVLNTVTMKIPDRQIRGDRLYDRAFSDLSMLYSGPSFLDALPEANRSIDRAIELRRIDLCIELSAVLLQSLITADPIRLSQSPANVKGILDAVTRCGGLAREQSDGGPNGAANNVKSLMAEPNGQVVAERFLGAIRHINDKGVLSGFSSRMREIRDHFDAFEVLVEGAPS